ncbi:hypothetical protein EC973_003464 [Apophysomyces ossiformis]|uniref:AB hydrolase-1 domain-containing protein n=1 Tax=Apophysomyces ossiformis TaxID=679940 RepID=A0A8H7BFP7_9FUNG|nr:hypothetical protein EC973_003464 [Apophysomyces ossiformis]
MAVKPNTFPKKIVLKTSKQREPIPLHCFLSGAQGLRRRSTLVVLIHGAGGDHHQFDSVLPVLTKAGYCVLTCDLRYHGLSQHAPSDSGHFTFDAAIHDLDDIIRWFKRKYSTLKRINLFLGGISMGGMIAQECIRQKQSVWRRFDIKIRGCIGIACGPTNLAWPRLPWIDMYREEASVDLNAARTAIVASGIALNSQKEAQRALDKVHDQVLLQCLSSCAHSLPECPTEASEILAEQSIKLPHLLIHGEEDFHTAQVMEAWRQVNRSRDIPTVWESISNSGHLVTLDAGTYTGEAILRFIDSF